ncbi:nucleotidyltransferase family protein [Pedobacter hartonius]|uniref:Molybdenum cofactor cytidylyltransferase n=1 Tax=Pedobacter hartonius TaxID=425514 RepID=A0A1H4FUQ6_9SPHI|nr:nucleotidyltransferase family protein [Pedobacter hartonius]SEB00570.1 molybdenum cofactor cytidylyltransferase [Pedobacter hartonius]
MNSVTKYGIIILAAGPSSRLGQPKQLLSYQDKSLLMHTIDASKNAVDGSVLVILGGNYQLIAESIEHTGIRIVYNPDWEEGMSSSIRKGLQGLMDEHTDLEGVILTVCDQPFLTARVLTALQHKANITGKNIVASAYGGTLGTPVLFTRRHFDDLMALKGPEGAKKLLKKYDEELASVPFENGEIDIDTMDDYNRLTAL